MRPAARRRIAWVGVLIAGLVGGEAPGEEPGGGPPDLEEVRARAEKIVAEAEAVKDQAARLRDAGKEADARKSLETLISLLDQLEGLCDDLEKKSVVLAKQAQVLLDSDLVDKAREILAKQRAVNSLEKELRNHLEALRKTGAGAEPPGEEDPPTSKPLEGLAARWFGTRSGVRRHSFTVKFGLDWLKAHQDEKGHWDCDGFGARCRKGLCGGRGYALFDPGVTGLALLAFLGAGETHEAGRYRSTVKSGLDYLKRIQDPDGCFGPRSTTRFTYNHACAALAMVEAYALTGSPLYKRSAQAAVDFIETCRNPDLAWRYRVKPKDNDTSVTGWMVSALFAARVAGLDVPERSFDGARSWVNRITEPEYGKVGYDMRGIGSSRPQDLLKRFPPERSEALTAVGIMIRVFLGETPARNPLMSKGADLCLKLRPTWHEGSGSIDMVYWFYGAMALHQVGGSSWKSWKYSLEKALEPNQKKEGCSKGSWDPVGPWGREGGRVYSTALCTLALETSLRHGRIVELR